MDAFLAACTPSEVARLIAALEQRGVAARVVAPPRAILNDLPPRVRDRAEAARTAIARKFDVDPHGFEIVRVRGEDGVERAVVVLASGNGLARGPWEDIFADGRNDEYRVDVGGEMIDVRAAMTWPVYTTLIHTLTTRGVFPLPDSSELTASNTSPWTCTLLTGEPEDVDGRRVPFAWVSDGEPGRSWGGRDYPGGLRFRPAVALDV